MHAGAISKLLYGFACVRAITHLLKLVYHLPVHTHKPYNNFCKDHKLALLYNFTSVYTNIPSCRRDEFPATRRYSCIFTSICTIKSLHHDQLNNHDLI